MFSKSHLAILTAAAASLYVVPAISQEQAASADTALSTDAQSYARDYGVSLAEAKRRLLIMTGAGDEIAALEQQFGDTLSGVYFDNSSEFKLVVRTTEKKVPKNGSIKVKGGKGKDQVGELDLPVAYVPDAKISRKLAKALMKDNKKSVSTLLPDLQAVSYDERSGEVVFQVNDVPSNSASYAMAQASLEKQLKAPVRIDLMPGVISTKAMRGGAAMVYGTTSDPFCTTAFAAKKDSTGELGMLTAGHCGDDPQTWVEGGKRYPLAAQTYFDEWADFAFLTGAPVVGEFYAQRNEAPRRLSGRREHFNTNARDDARGVSGSYVCFYGRNTGPQNGQQCGEVTSIWFEPRYPNNPSAGFYGCSNGPSYVRCQNNYVEVRPKGTATMYCRGGDSGAPVFAFTTAFGILSGCTDITGKPNQVSNYIYTSTDELYINGYSLVYP